jgi:hypothetical protein
LKPKDVERAAEAIAAAQFARCGFAITVQYGPNQPEFDLIVARGDHMLKVSVKGSSDGGWGLTQSHMSGGNYHGAIDAWLKTHGSRTVLCLVQFMGVPLKEMPRVYLATPTEIGVWLKSAAGGRGQTVLDERHVWSMSKFVPKGTVDQIPQGWLFTEQRVDEVFAAFQI